MPASSLAGLVAVLREADSFVLTSHANPDGDSIGSILAMRHLLHAMGKTRIACVIDGPVPRLYEWLPGAETISAHSGLPGPVDLAIILDVSRRARLGLSLEAVTAASQVLVIDHHLDDAPDGDVFYVDPMACAIGEIIVELYTEAGISLTREAAECAYVSMATDTGGFRFANTTPKSHLIAAKLIEAGIDVSDISSRVFDVMSQAKFELLRRVLHRVRLDIGGRLAYAVLTQQDMTEAAARSEDADGLVNYLRNIEGVEVGILFREVDGVSTKVSIRSRDGFNCANFLAHFGGGGHARAAGATMGCPAERACTSVIDRIRRSFGGAV